MSAPTLLGSAARGFSLIELMVALAIAMLLLASLSGVFARSIKTRDKIDLEGQKIETARYALDILAEDVRLADVELPRDHGDRLFRDVAVAVLHLM